MINFAPVVDGGKGRGYVYRKGKSQNTRHSRHRSRNPVRPASGVVPFYSGSAPRTNHTPAPPNTLAGDKKQQMTQPSRPAGHTEKRPAVISVLRADTNNNHARAESIYTLKTTTRVNITTQEKKTESAVLHTAAVIGCAMPQQRDPGQRGRKHGAARPNSLSVCSRLFGSRAARSSVAPPGQARHRARSRVSTARGKICRTVPRRLCLERHDLAIHSQPCTRQRVALLNPATRERQKTPQTHKTQNTINTAAAVVLHQ